MTEPLPEPGLRDLTTLQQQRVIALRVAREVIAARSVLTSAAVGWVDLTLLADWILNGGEHMDVEVADEKDPAHEGPGALCDEASRGGDDPS